MEEENNPLWPWILGFIAYRSYRNRKKNRFYAENFYDDEMFDDYFEEEWIKVENLELDADFWIACFYCFEDNQNVDQYLKVGIELESTSLIVNCQKHKRTLKLFRLAEEEIDMLPSKCRC